MIDILAILFMIVIFSGSYMAITSPENSKKRPNGWLTMTIGALLNSMLVFYQGRIWLGFLNIGVAALDFWLFLVHWTRYKKAKMSQRERFLNEITKSRL
jgi:hypothetical protein